MNRWMYLYITLLMQTNEWHNIFVYSCVGSYKKQKPVACLYTVVIKTPYKHAEVIEHRAQSSVASGSYYCHALKRMDANSF